MSIYRDLARTIGVNTTKPQKTVRRSLKLAVLSMAFGRARQPSDNLTGMIDMSWMLTVRARVQHVEGGYALWLYRTPTGERLPCNRLIGQRIISGVSWYDGVAEARYTIQPWRTIGDALRASCLYFDGVPWFDEVAGAMDGVAEAPFGWTCAG